MFIDPRDAIERGWVQGITNPDKQIQPNALDFTIDRLFSIDGNIPFRINEEEMQMRGGVELSPFQDYWYLDPNTSYDAMSDVYVDLPNGVAALLIVRSTFNRNGLFLTSGLYDSGFKGNVGFAIHNVMGDAYIAPGTRVGQLIFVKSEESEALYSGGYNTAKGEYWADKGE